MKKIILLIIILCSFISCDISKKENFSLSVNTDLIPENEYVYIEYYPENNFDTKIVLDSIRIKNNKLTFEKPFPYFPISTVIYSKGYSDSKKYYESKRIWIENSKMTFTAKDIDFKSGIVTGSDTHQIYEKLKREDYKSEEELIIENPTNIISAYYLNEYKYSYGKAKTLKLYNQLSDNVKKSKDGILIDKYIQINKSPIVGDKYIDFEIQNQLGQKVKFSSIKNKMILLEFWASWCGGCRKSNEKLTQVHAKYKSKGFEICAISLDSDKNKWIKAIEIDSIKNWVNLSDLKRNNSEIKMLYGVIGVPDNFLIDQNGEIIARDISSEELDKLLKNKL
ncbi:AhpC/TSA family protein [Aureivirga sp. CE67]|uniref:AhpC/TSA family protein n=1 Tax=Aureivirga sp. CE67 TaxID=1788983 RepID=UPI0018C9D90C|nr:AhpC/TSA family protein [Aureivirga sp. CE67]